MNRGEGGQITVMTIGFFLVLGLLSVVVVNSSTAFVQRQQLDNLADGAALAAADGLSRESFYRDGVVRVDGQQASRLVADYVTGQNARVVQVRVDRDRVYVRMERLVDLAIAPPGWRSSATIRSEASSQLRLGGGR